MRLTDVNEIINVILGICICHGNFNVCVTSFVLRGGCRNDERTGRPPPIDQTLGMVMAAARSSLPRTRGELSLKSLTLGLSFV